jgi:glycosyltransferase involved in cell wall biosynthesis
MISAIVSTYNRPDFLGRVLWGWAMQTRGDFELVIADDGSGPETAALIERMRAETRLDIVHVWHEDNGFRKTEILNRAIVAARGDLHLFSDGDCIPRADLVATHYELARPGHFLAGGYLKLPAHVSSVIGVEDVKAGRHADLRWLRRQGWRPGRRALRLTKSRTLAAIYDRLTPTSPDFQGNNTSVWKTDLIEANGFEGLMGYGGLDQALGYRLENMGVKGIQARHRAVTMHLHHDRPYRLDEVRRRNREIMADIKRRGLTRAQQGIAELTPDPSLRMNGRPVHETRAS